MAQINNFSAVISDVQTYLENKYAEKFDVVRLVSDNGVPGVPNKAYVHPEGRVDEWFAVRFDFDEEISVYSDFSDGYGFIFAERLILPKYEAWLTNALPSAKLTVTINKEFEVTNEKHTSNVILSDFIKKEHPFAIRVIIFIRDRNRDDFLKSLSRSLIDAPCAEVCSYYHVVFIKDNNFDMSEVWKYKCFESLELRKINEATAITTITISEDMTTEEILTEMLINLDNDPHILSSEIEVAEREALSETLTLDEFAQLENVIDIKTGELKEDATSDALKQILGKLDIKRGGMQND